MSEFNPSRRRFIQLGGFALASAGLAGCSTFHTAKVLTAPSLDLTIMNSGGFKAAYQMLLPLYEKSSGNHLVSVWGPSMGQAPDAIPNRLARGENADVAIMVGYALDKLIAAGLVYPTSKVNLSDSRIGAVVRAGMAKPDISTVQGLRTALLQAPSVAYSDSASGLYVANELFKKLGIENEMRGKAHMVQQTPVAQKVAAGEYALGLQQVSEILPVAGATFIGKIPEAVQSITTYSAGVIVKSHHPKQAQEFIQFLTSLQAQQAILASGMDLVKR